MQQYFIGDPTSETVRQSSRSRSPGQPSRSSTSSPARLRSLSSGPTIHPSHTSTASLSAPVKERGRSKKPVDRFTIAGPSDPLKHARTRTEKPQGRESASPPPHRESSPGHALQSARGQGAQMAVRTRASSSASDGQSSSAHSQYGKDRRSSVMFTQAYEQVPILGAGDKGKAPAIRSEVPRAYPRRHAPEGRELAPESPATIGNVVQTSLTGPGKRARSKDHSPLGATQRPRLGASSLSSTEAQQKPIMNVHPDLPVLHFTPRTGLGRLDPRSLSSTEARKVPIVDVHPNLPVLHFTPRTNAQQKPVVQARASLPSQTAAQNRAANHNLARTTTSRGPESKSPSPDRRR